MGLEFSREEYDAYCKVVHMSGITFQETYIGRPPSTSLSTEDKPSAVPSSASPHNDELPAFTIDQIWPDFWDWQPLPGNVEDSDRKSVHRAPALYKATDRANNELSMLAQANMRAASKAPLHMSKDLEVWKALLLESYKFAPGTLDDHFSAALGRDQELEAHLRDLETDSTDD